MKARSRRVYLCVIGLLGALISGVNGGALSQEDGPSDASAQPEINSLKDLKSAIESPAWRGAIQSMEEWAPTLVAGISWETRLSDHFVLHYYCDHRDENDRLFQSLLGELERINSELEEFFRIETTSKREELALKSRLVCFIVKTETKRTFGSLTDPHILFFLLDPVEVPDYLLRLRHEVAHWVWGRLYGEAPPLFQEGVAVYAEKMSSPKAQLGEFLGAGDSLEGEIPPLSEVAIGENFWKHRKMYTVGSLWVYHLVQSRGWEKLKQLFLRSSFEDPGILEHFREVYGRDLQEVEAEWRASMVSRKGERAD